MQPPLGPQVGATAFPSRVGFGLEDITPLLEQWNKALAELHRAGMAICEKAGVPTNRLKGWDEGKDIPVTEFKRKDEIDRI